VSVAPIVSDALVENVVTESSPNGCVYVGQRLINPVIVKIGYSTFRRLRRRMREKRLHLLLALPGDRALERETHERFADYRCDVDGAEFFFLANAVRAWIEEEKGARKPEAPEA
jgi:hypothetical protein